MHDRVENPVNGLGVFEPLRPYACVGRELFGNTEVLTVGRLEWRIIANALIQPSSNLRVAKHRTPRATPAARTRRSSGRHKRAHPFRKSLQKFFAGFCSLIHGKENNGYRKRPNVLLSPAHADAAIRMHSDSKPSLKMHSKTPQSQRRRCTRSVLSDIQPVYTAT
jgi:hypothetical protein